MRWSVDVINPIKKKSIYIKITFKLIGLICPEKSLLNKRLICAEKRLFNNLVFGHLGK